MPLMTQASYSRPASVLRRSIRGARSRNLGSIRVEYMSGGSTMWESAEISLYPAMVTSSLDRFLRPVRSVIRNGISQPPRRQAAGLGVDASHTSTGIGGGWPLWQRESKLGQLPAAGGAR